MAFSLVDTHTQQAIPLSESRRTWRPDALTLIYQAPGLRVTEVKRARGNLLFSSISLTNTSDQARELACVWDGCAMYSWLGMPLDWGYGDDRLTGRFDPELNGFVYTAQDGWQVALSSSLPVVHGQVYEVAWRHIEKRVIFQTAIVRQRSSYHYRPRPAPAIAAGPPPGVDPISGRYLAHNAAAPLHLAPAETQTLHLVMSFSPHAA